MYALKHGEARATGEKFLDGIADSVSVAKSFGTRRSQITMKLLPEIISGEDGFIDDDYGVVLFQMTASESDISEVDMCIKSG